MYFNVLSNNHRDFVIMQMKPFVKDVRANFQSYKMIIRKNFWKNLHGKSVIIIIKFIQWLILFMTLVVAQFNFSNEATIIIYKYYNLKASYVLSVNNGNEHRCIQLNIRNNLVAVPILLYMCSRILNK